MTSQEKLQRDIETLKESIRLNWQELGTTSFKPTDRDGIRQNIKWCLEELQSLYDQLEN
ncbi:MAG: hypothetical protein Q7T94_06750 [Rugosibacter sp.]|nr:hypothetical protein [Rugosibacter sp.]